MPLYMGTRNYDDLPFDNPIEHSIWKPPQQRPSGISLHHSVSVWVVTDPRETFIERIAKLQAQTSPLCFVQANASSISAEAAGRRTMEINGA
jgi:hypothetical protein